MRTIFLLQLLLLIVITANAQHRRYITEGRYLNLTEEGKEYYKKNLPSSVDNSTSTYFPPIYQQTHWVCNQVAASYYSFSYENNRAKDRSSQDLNNCFSIYFPWNWMNGGHGWWGSHFTTSFNMLKNVGVPPITQFVGDTERDSAVWMTGYDNYYEAMKNRIEDYYLINTSTEDGLLMLKGWIYDHGRNEQPGGVGVFLSNPDPNIEASYLPPESAHAGQYVIRTCSDNPAHSRTLVGYDDNIYWDYNNDGQFTNDIDLNNDGIIDVRDWEKGGFKYAESFGPDWGDNGFAYIMYKCFADKLGEGGILNHDVGVVEPLVSYEPMLTASVRLKYEDRNNLKISFGVSANPDAEIPDYELDFPIMNYSEGDQFYMQGGNTEEDKTIELGFDISPLLDKINSGSEAAFFLIIREYDVHSNYTLDIQDFTIYAYTSCPEASYSYSGDFSTINNSISYLKQNIAINFNKPQIITENIPMFNTDGDFHYYMQSSQGEPPIEWSLHPVITQEINNLPYETFTENKITPDSYFDGILSVSLPFDFPFNNEYIRDIKVHSDGYLLLDSLTNVWSYSRDYLIDYFINEKIIAPHLRYNFVCDPTYSDGIWYTGDNEKASFRWQCSQQYSEEWSSARFGVDLFPNGDIVFVYGSNNSSIQKKATSLAGISLGDNTNYLICNRDEMNENNTEVALKIFPLPENLSLSKVGVLSGNLNLAQAYPIGIKIRDKNNRTDYKIFHLSTGIEEVGISAFKIFPNPAIKDLTIELEQAAINPAQFEIFDINGKLVHTFQIGAGNKFTQISISFLKKGVYTLRWIKPNSIQVKKITIQ